jgi:aldose 1-epimerase
VSGTFAVVDQRDAGLWVLEIRDERGGQRLRLLPEIGGTLIEYAVRRETGEVPVLDPPPELASLLRERMRWGCPILFPFPGRIRNGKYIFKRRTYVLTESLLDGHHIHGLVYGRPWRIERCQAGPAGAIVGFKLRSRDFPEIKAQYPFPFEISAEYALTPAGLAISIDVRNTGPRALPMGLGLHPYFCLPLHPASPREACRVRVPARARWELEQLIPTGQVMSVAGAFDLREGRALDGMELDDIFTDIEEAVGDAPVRCELEDEAAGLRIVLEAAASFREVVVYTPPGRPSVCVEPYTCAADAPNLKARGTDSGLRVLKPGERFHASVRLRLESME